MLSSPFQSIIFNLPPAKAVRGYVCHLTSCGPDCLCSLWCSEGPAIYLFYAYLVPPKQTVDFWRAELEFYVSLCLLESCLIPTWCSINIQEKKRYFLDPTLQGSKDLFYAQSSEIKSQTPAKLLPFAFFILMMSLRCGFIDFLCL